MTAHERAFLSTLAREELKLATAALGVRGADRRSPDSMRRVLARSPAASKEAILRALAAECRTLPSGAEPAEVRVGCRILDLMAALGMPESHRVD